MKKDAHTPSRSQHSRRVVWVFVTLAIALLAAVLAWVSTTCPDCGDEVYSTSLSLGNWFAYLVVILVGAGILLGGWWALQASEKDSVAEPSRISNRLPAWLFTLLIGAALFRLAMGVTWYLTVPYFGHGTPQEMDGYIAADAYERDQLAWKLSQSSRSLWQTVESGRRADPYGGMLFLSTGIYRFTSNILPGDQEHFPLMLVVITATFSALAVLFTWGFARHAWDDQIARYAAWGIALYPEAVLLGSSQMREAFIIPLVATAFYGLVHLRAHRSWVGLIWLLAGLFLTLFFSPPITILLVVSLLIVGLGSRKERLSSTNMSGSRKLPGWAWLLVIVAIILVMIGGWLALKQFAPQGVNNPIDILMYWLRKSADLQAYYSKNASGWLQKIFRTTPEWIHLPVLTAYGVLRPFLPAALMVSSEAPIWRLITLWRALGWTILLGLLAYAILRAWILNKQDSFTRALTLVVMLTILVASLRGGGDQDDNPRYRAAFSSIQIALAAWGYVEQRRSQDVLFRRSLVTVVFIFVWSLLWYLRRLYPIEGIVADPFKIIGLGLACGALYAIWDFTRNTSSADP